MIEPRRLTKMSGMNVSRLHAKLIAAARSNPPGDQVPYAFEKRVMARLQSGAVEDAWTVWGKALWRSAFACMALAAALSIWSLQASGEEDQDLDSTMFSAAEQLADSW